jgi:plastocyanin
MRTRKGDHMRRHTAWTTRAVIAAFALAILAGAGCGEDDGVDIPPEAGASGDEARNRPVDGLRSVVVEIEADAFVPPNVSIPPGAEVKWYNDSGRPMTLVKVGGTSQDFDPQRIGPGRTYQRTFVKTGRFVYGLDSRADAKGTVTVVR